ncbi:DUF2306 domain-containing protein [Specibacter cremeus]|uniref:DUF2306 domain-containing protein n=1 Tax=Specibacter cremeus TaxID=1629051 RepID=UPI000F79702C|nr:DUF2306 domain-containing protein [Specibacter cremeus]
MESSEISSPAADPVNHPLGRRLSWAWIVYSSLSIAGFFVGQYLTGPLQRLSVEKVGLAPHYASAPAAVQVAFYCHILFAGAALALGPWQFSARIRRRFRRFHRANGRVYLVCVGVGGVAAFVMSFFNSAGMVGFFGFGTLAVLWECAAWRAYRAIRAGDVRSHQAWMMRTFALTYAAVTLRLWLGVLISVQIPFATRPFEFQPVFNNAYAALPFLAWLPNLVVVEGMIRRRGLPSLRMVPEPVVGVKPGP